MKKLVIMFWKVIGIVYDFRPRLHLPKYSDFPIASTEIKIDGKYDYSSLVGIKILYEWDEKGKHWIVFTR